MKLRIKYIACVVLMHGTVLVLSYFVFKDNKIVFIASEAILLFSLFVFWQLYHELLQPLKLLMQSTEAIKEKDFSVKLVPTGKYELDQLIGVYNRMIDALREERTRQEEQHFFLDKLIRSSPTGILIMNFDGQVRQINPKALEMLEMDEQQVLQKGAGALQHPLVKKAMSLPAGGTATFAYGAATYKLQRLQFIDQGFARPFIMIGELTVEILAAEKKTYGKVIRMMAHEVNNTIGPVNSIIQSTLDSQQHPEVLAHALQVAIERNENLNRFMRNFARLVQLPVPVKKPVDMQLLAGHATDLFHVQAAGRNIELKSEWGADSFMVNCDAQQMEQVIVNILKNALEAIEAGGTVALITSLHPRRLVIRDSGKGISEESGQQLFSPFYSTKRDGQGIGLTIIREILLNHGFEFSLKTVKPGITEFGIWFEKTAVR